jgi:hypothetical protein
MATQNDNGDDIFRLSIAEFNLFSEDDDEEWGNFDPALLGIRVNELTKLFLNTAIYSLNDFHSSLL